MTNKIAGCILIAIWAVGSCTAQELVPRRWSHLPIGVNFAGGGYVYTGAKFSVDPVLRLENVVMDRDTYPVKYIRTFEIAGKLARFDWVQAYQDARWSGLIDGAPASTSRNGWSDMAIRFAVNLVGSPPLPAKEFAKYRSEIEDETIVGIGLILQLPTGQYLDDKLLNLGTNRVTFRPQLGASYTKEKWSTEATVSSWIYTDNAEFFGGNYLEQDSRFKDTSITRSGQDYGLEADSVTLLEAARRSTTFSKTIESQTSAGSSVLAIHSQKIWVPRYRISDSSR